MNDTVFIRGLELSCVIGVYPEEKHIARQLELDIDIRCDCQRAGESDDLVDALNYATVCQAVRAEIGEGPFDLVETVAERTAKAVLRGFEAADAVRVKVTKTGAVAGVESVGVIIERVRAGVSNVGFAR